MVYLTVCCIVCMYMAIVIAYVLGQEFKEQGVVSSGLLLAMHIMSLTTEWSCTLTQLTGRVLTPPPQVTLHYCREERVN